MTTCISHIHNHSYLGLVDESYYPHINISMYCPFDPQSERRKMKYQKWRCVWSNKGCRASESQNTLEQIILQETRAFLPLAFVKISPDTVSIPFSLLFINTKKKNPWLLLPCKIRSLKCHSWVECILRNKITLWSCLVLKNIECCNVSI